MIIFKVKKSDLSILKKYLKDNALLYIIDKYFNKNTSLYKFEDNTLEVSFTLKESEKLLDYLSNILMKHGFDEYDDLNYIGKDIERLIDIFNYYDKI